MPLLTTTVEPTVELTPRQQQELRAAFQVYRRLKTDLDETAEDVEKAKARLAALREQIGGKSVGIDGFRVTYVGGGTTKRLNKRKLRLLGVTQAQIDMATTESPKKSHELVTCPGDKPQRHDDEDD